MSPPVVSPVLSCFAPAVLSTRQTPAVLLRSQKTPVSPGAGHGPGPPPRGRVSRCVLGNLFCGAGVVHDGTGKNTAQYLPHRIGTNQYAGKGPPYGEHDISGVGRSPPEQEQAHRPQYSAPPKTPGGGPWRGGAAPSTPALRLCSGLCGGSGGKRCVPGTDGGGAGRTGPNPPRGYGFYSGLCPFRAVHGRWGAGGGDLRRILG